MITDQQRAELKAKIEELIGFHDHLRYCAVRRDDAAAFSAGTRCNETETALYFWIDKEL